MFDTGTPSWCGSTGLVLAREAVRVKAFRLGQALDWAAAQARVKGCDQVTVACEPTGPRWMRVQRLCAERGLPRVRPAAGVPYRPGAAGPYDA